MNFDEYFRYQINIPTYIAIFKTTKRCGYHKKGTVVYLDRHSGQFYKLGKSRTISKRDAQVYVRGYGDEDHLNFYIEFVEYAQQNIPKEYLLKKKKQK